MKAKLAHLVSKILLFSFFNIRCKARAFSVKYSLRAIHVKDIYNTHTVMRNESWPHSHYTHIHLLPPLPLCALRKKKYVRSFWTIVKRMKRIKKLHFRPLLSFLIEICGQASLHNANFPNHFLLIISNNIRDTIHTYTQFCKARLYDYNA